MHHPACFQWLVIKQPLLIFPVGIFFFWGGGELGGCRCILLVEKLNSTSLFCLYLPLRYKQSGAYVFPKEKEKKRSHVYYRGKGCCIVLKQVIQILWETNLMKENQWSEIIQKCKCVVLRYRNRSRISYLYQKETQKKNKPVRLFSKTMMWASKKKK